MLDWGNVPAWVAAAVSGLFGLLSWRAARRSKKAEVVANAQADRASNAAEEAVAAQQVTAQETKRLADLMSNRATGAERKPWRVEKGRGDWEYYLVNATAQPKFDVTLDGDPIRMASGTDNLGEVDGHARVSMDVALFHGADYTVTISWYPTKDSNSEKFTQRTELGS